MLSFPMTSGESFMPHFVPAGVGRRACAQPTLMDRTAEPNTFALRRTSANMRIQNVLLRWQQRSAKSRMGKTERCSGASRM